MKKEWDNLLAVKRECPCCKNKIKIVVHYNEGLLGEYDVQLAKVGR